MSRPSPSWPGRIYSAGGQSIVAARFAPDLSSENIVTLVGSAYKATLEAQVSAEDGSAVLAYFRQMGQIPSPVQSPGDPAKALLLSGAAELRHLGHQVRHVERLEEDVLHHARVEAAQLIGL